MKIVAFEAKNKLGQLLDLVERGVEATITRHGKDVARIVPARSRPARDQARAAIQRIRERAEAARLGRLDWVEWKAYRDEPRRELCSGQPAALAWIYDDETTDPIRFVFSTVAEQGAFAPSLWRLEIANSLAGAVRRGTRCADRFLLTVYNAAYVELAQRRALPLATLDRDMQRAGAQLGLRVLGVD